MSVVNWPFYAVSGPCDGVVVSSKTSHPRFDTVLCTTHTHTHKTLSRPDTTSVPIRADTHAWRRPSQSHTHTRTHTLTHTIRSSSGTNAQTHTHDSRRPFLSTNACAYTQDRVQLPCEVHRLRRRRRRGRRRCRRLCTAERRVRAMCL